MQAFVVSTMKRLFRAWKSRLHAHYKKFHTDEERLSNLPKGISREDWQWLIQHFGDSNFKVETVILRYYSN